MEAPILKERNLVLGRVQLGLKDLDFNWELIMAFNFGGNWEVNLNDVNLESIEDLLEVNNVEQLFHLEERDCTGEKLEKYRQFVSL